MKYKYINKFILSIIILLFVSNVGYANKEDMIIIGGDENYPPYEFVDENGDYRGFNVDIIRALALELGIDIRFEPMSWKDVMIALENGEIDAIQGMSFSEERAKRYEFSNKHLENSLIFFVEKEDSFIFDLKDLEGKTVAVQRNDLADQVASSVKDIHIMQFTDLEEAIQKLLNDEVDVVIGSKLVGTYILRQEELLDKIKTVGYEFNQTPYSIAFQKGDTELRNLFDRGLSEIKQNGIYEKIYEKWFGERENQRNKTLKYIIYVFSFGILAFMFISFIIYRINRRLKLEVKNRTKELKHKNIELNNKQKIIESQYKFNKQVLDNLGIGLITFDREGRYTTINNAIKDLIKKDKNLIGEKYSSERLGKYFDTDKIEGCIKQEKKYIYSEKSFIEDEKEITFSYTLCPLYGDQDKHIGGVLTFRDISDVKIYEEKLNQKDKMESLGILVSGIAHEIRNPLTVIKTYIDLLPIKYDNKSFRQKITTQVPVEINRLNNLLTELLDYSKPKKVKKQVINLKKLIDGISEIFGSQFRDKNINFVVDVDDLSIYGDKNQMKQIIINFLLNSLDATEENGNVKISIRKKDSNVEIIIEDTGEGISKQDLGRIFNPFYTTKSTGTGLGLFMCYKYIKENKGEVKVNSEKGKGTKIIITFPGVRMEEFKNE